MRKLFLVWMTGLVGLALLPSTWGQQAQQPSPPPPPQKEAPKPKPKKVWTDDNVLKLRTAADDYAAQKQSTEQAADPAGAAQPDSSAKAGTPKKEQTVTRDPYIPPTTVEEAKTLLAAKWDEIQGQEELIRRTREEYLNETNDAIRDALKKRIDQLTTDLKEAETHLKLLERSLAELKSKAQPESPQPPQVPQATSDKQPPPRS